MTSTRTDKPTNVTTRPDEVGTAPASRPNPAPVFSFAADDDSGPEVAILGASRTMARPIEAASGVDLSGKKKIVFWIGRGKTGKTTAIRWSAEAALLDGTALLMADMDPTNDTFSQYVANVARPPEASDPALALKWLDKLLQHALDHKLSVLVDLGGGDTTLRRLVSQLPDLVQLVEAQGFAMVLFYTVGPQEEDLSPLATMEGLGFRPTATAIVLNEAMAEVGDPPPNAFARILRHSVFLAAVKRGAVPIWMPRLLPAQQVEIRRLQFRDAAAGETGQGKTPLGPFDRSRVLNWLQTMDASFAGIKTWLP
ncbi:MAG: hypothetical protein ABSC06_21855 [Rhodopila sp.]